MGAIETVIRLSKKAEHILEKTYDADGRGLHEKLSSVEGKLPLALVKKLRYVATIRNKLVHEYDYELENPEEFYIAAKQAIAELEQFTDQLAKEKEEKEQKEQEERFSAAEYENDDELEEISWFGPILFITLMFFVAYLFFKGMPEAKASEIKEVEQQAKVLSDGTII